MWHTHTGRVEAIPCYVQSHNECCLHMTMYKYVCMYTYIQTTPLSVSVMQAASYTPACITLTDNVQRDRYRAPSSTSGSWAHTWVNMLSKIRKEGLYNLYVCTDISFALHPPQVHCLGQPQSALMGFSGWKQPPQVNTNGELPISVSYLYYNNTEQKAETYTHTSCTVFDCTGLLSSLTTAILPTAQSSSEKWCTYNLLVRSACK